MAQAVILWPVTAETLSLYVWWCLCVCSGRSGTVTRLSPSTPLCTAIILLPLFHIHRRSQWPCGLRRGSLRLTSGWDVVSSPAGGIDACLFL